MSARHRRAAPSAALGLVLMLAATSCAAPTTPEPTGPAMTTTPTADPGSGATSTPAPSDPGEPVPAADVGCEDLIGPDLVTELESQGWTPREDPFYIGDLELPDGIACTWGDFSGETAGDDLLLFGWSPISGEDAAAAQSSLASEGWIVEESDDGTYVTEDPAQAIALDDEGYGITYLFGDGWVTLSDTKQGLILIERPGA